MRYIQTSNFVARINMMEESIRKYRRKPRIDVVPLIDVLMVLIIFFLVTMQFQDLRAINVKLPKIESAGSNLVRNELIISIKEKGETFCEWQSNGSSRSGKATQN